LRGEKSQYKELGTYLFQLANEWITDELYLPPPEPGICEEATLESVIDDLITSDNVCITFGAGFSGGYVPTLIEFFDQLGIKKLSSVDAITDESMQNFINNLINNKDDVWNKITEIWLKVRDCKITTTPAHEALLKIIRLLEMHKKMD
jgi:hypothetical protein